MNNPSPLVPQGSMLEQKSKSRARVKVAFFCVVGVHVAAIVVALLAQGCKREQPPVAETTQPPVPEMNTNLPTLDTNVTATAPTNYIPPTPPPVPPVDPTPMAPAATGQEHTIQKGDNFSTLALKYHVTVKALQQANPTVDPTKLQIGKKITIPAPTAAAPTATPGTTVAPAADGAETYTVKSGDTLIKIAGDHHITVNALKRANNLSTDRITVGQKLKIPAGAAPAPTAPPVETAPAPTAPPSR